MTICSSRRGCTWPSNVLGQPSTLLPLSLPLRLSHLPHIQRSRNFQGRNSYFCYLKFCFAKESRMWSFLCSTVLTPSSWPLIPIALLCPTLVSPSPPLPFCPRAYPHAPVSLLSLPSCLFPCLFTPHTPTSCRRPPSRHSHAPGRGHHGHTRTLS